MLTSSKGNKKKNVHTLLWAKRYPSPNSYVEALTPVPQNGIVFGDEALYNPYIILHQVIYTLRNFAYYQEENLSPFHSNTAKYFYKSGETQTWRHTVQGRAMRNHVKLTLATNS